MVGLGSFRLNGGLSHPWITGRVDPIPFHVKQDMTGLGKYGQDARMIETTVSQRRELASERLLKENEDQRAEREVCRRRTSPVAPRDSRRGRTTSLAEHISNPRSQKPFDPSIA